MSIKLSDYVAEQLAAWGAERVFMVTGGGAMHLNDSLAHAQGLRCVYLHHEQAAAMAAEGWSRVRGRTAVVNVTTGPGGVNALNGVFGAYTDSIPQLILSGQVKRETCMRHLGLKGLRQLGDQEIDIVEMARGVVKFAAFVDDPNDIVYLLEKAWRLAGSGRPGPCWLDIPVDVQSARIEPDKLRRYDPAEDAPAPLDRNRLENNVAEVIDRLGAAKRPVVMAGSGVRIGHAEALFERLIRRLRLPVVTAWTHDLLDSRDELFCGRPGSIGDRAGNFTVQNSDALLVLGSRLNLRQTSYNWRSFARKAFKMQVDIDPAELAKPTTQPELALCYDLNVFLDEMLRQLGAGSGVGAHAAWLERARAWRDQYPVVQPRQRLEGPPLNPYGFVGELFEHLAADDVICCGNASATIMPYQAGRLQKGQRLLSNSGAASMGHDLPCSIGAACAREGGRVICLAGDGSLQMNLQELQTVVGYGLPIKIFVLDNGGYLSMRITQENFFGRYSGADPATGVTFPNMEKIAEAYGIHSRTIATMSEARAAFAELERPGAALYVVKLDPSQQFEPRMKSRQLPDGSIVTPNLEDMFPFLSEEELKKNMEE